MCRQWCHTLLSHSIIKKIIHLFFVRRSKSRQHSFRYFLVVEMTVHTHTHAYNTRALRSRDNNESDIGTAHWWQRRWRRRLQYRRRRQWQTHHQHINSTFFTNLRILAECEANQTTTAAAASQQREKKDNALRVWCKGNAWKYARRSAAASAHSHTHTQRAKHNKSLLSEGEKAI